MKTLAATLPAALLLAGPAFAQLEENEGYDAAGGVAGMLEEQAEANLRAGDMGGEMEERVLAQVMDNYISMDVNQDRLISESEWGAWRGWNETPLSFTGADFNDSDYVAFTEFERTYIETGDERLSKPMHGARPAEEGREP